MYLRTNTKKCIVDEVRASPTDTIPDVAENSRSKDRKAKGGRVAPYFVAVQMDDPGPPPPEFAVVPPTPTATNTTPRPLHLLAPSRRSCHHCLLLLNRRETLICVSSRGNILNSVLFRVAILAALKRLDGKTIGVMITTSHNLEAISACFVIYMREVIHSRTTQNNGLKLVDSHGEMNLPGNRTRWCLQTHRRQMS